MPVRSWAGLSVDSSAVDFYVEKIKKAYVLGIYVHVVELLVVRIRSQNFSVLHTHFWHVKP